MIIQLSNFSSQLQIQQSAYPGSGKYNWDRQKTTVERTFQDTYKQVFGDSLPWQRAFTSFEANQFKTRFYERINELQTAYVKWEQQGHDSKLKPQVFLVEDVAKIARSAFNQLFASLEKTSEPKLVHISLGDSPEPAGSPQAATSNLLFEQFKRDDYSYRGRLDPASSDCHALEFAENCCAFPQLALAVAKYSGRNIKHAAIAINHCERAQPKKASLTPNDILPYLALVKDAQ